MSFLIRMMLLSFNILCPFEPQLNVYKFRDFSNRADNDRQVQEDARGARKQEKRVNKLSDSRTAHEEGYKPIPIRQNIKCNNRVPGP